MFNITPIVTTNYAASWGELVRLDMRGKVAPDIVQIRLPPAGKTNAGQTLAIATTNPGGAEDGSAVQIVPPPGQTINGNVACAPQQNEQRLLFVSDGENIQCLSAT